MLTIIVAAVIVAAFAYVLLAEEGDGPISRHLFHGHNGDATRGRQDRLG